MNKMQNIIAGVGAVVAGLMLSAGSAFAVATYTMNTELQTGISTLLTDFVSGAFQIIVVAIGIIGGYWLSIQLVHLMIKWFHKFK